MDRTLSGAKVQRIGVSRIGSREVALFQVRIPGETIHIVLAGALGLGLVDEAQRNRLRDAMKSDPSSEQTLWRAQAEGARIVAVGNRWVDLIRLDSARSEQHLRASSNDSGVTLAHGLSLTPSLDVYPNGASLPSPRPFEAAQPSDWKDAASDRGRRILEALLGEQADGRRRAFERAVAKAVARFDRRIAAILGDLTKMTSALAAADHAQLFVVEAARAPRGTTTLGSVDWSSGSPRAVEMTIDASRAPQEQLTAVFRRARRLKDGAPVARKRLHEAEAHRNELVAIREALDTPGADIGALEARARNIVPVHFQGNAQGEAKSKRDRARPPFRQFIGASGLRILVGRSAAQNDRLTLHVARPHDIWLHAKGVAGAHVVISLDKGASCPSDTLVEAAHLALHFSDARGERHADVQYTPRRYVRKPRGSAPGAVVVDREKVIAVRLEEPTLRRLLASESEP